MLYKASNRTGGNFFLLQSSEKKYNIIGKCYFSLSTEHVMNYTYILRCSDDTLYTGWTNNLKKRLKSHNEKTGAKYTKGRTPVRLVYFEEYNTKEEAMRREFAIKRLTRAQKLSLIADFEQTRLTQYNAG